MKKEIEVVRTLKKYNIPLVRLSYVEEGLPNVKDRLQIHDSKTAYEILKENWEENTMSLHESFYVILMNRRNKIKAVIKVSEGSLAGTVIPVEKILMSAVLTASGSVIIAHNHPSGNTEPSDADKEMTKKIETALKIIGYRLLDHIILTTEGYLSFGDEGLLSN